MVSKHVCGYEQKITRIYDYGYTYDKRGNLVKEEEICSPTTTGDEFCAEKLLRKRILPKKPKERKKTIRIYLTAIIIFIAMSWLITFINYLRG